MENELSHLPATSERTIFKYHMFVEARQAQAGIIRTEAAHSSLFVAGWRPVFDWGFYLAVVWLFLASW